MPFKLINFLKVNNEIPVSKYISTDTGVIVYIAQVDSPVCNAYLALATEADSDDGIPHTLEHLVFLGSEEYPFKGVLDLLANRCLANGTNAWTETDNTVYTLSCAGSEGFLRLLPVYMDHILFPTLTKSGFITEVYSITEAGEDNGAVYCEMQGRENSGESRGHLELLRNSYPNHGYSMETGGIMKNIRDSLTIEKIRDYHKQYYRAENLAVVIAGKVEIEEVEKAIKPIEEKVLKRQDSYPKYTKPWQVPVKSLEESKDVKILFPSDEEEYGIVYIAFHGPQATTDYDTLTACYVLMKYLCDTSVSPVQQTFIEIEDPYASSVSYHITENSTSLLYFSFENVPISKIDLIKDRMVKLFSDIANGVQKIDETRLKIVFEKYILERLSSLENSPHDDVTFHILGDFLYADKKEDFAKRLNVTDIITELQKQPITYWLDLLRKFYVDNKSITIRATPSIEEKEKIAKEEVERIEKRRQELGDEGLKEKGQELSNAMKDNDRPPPLEMLTSLPVPSTKSINFHSLEVYKKGDKNVKVNLDQFPFYIEAYNIKTNFVYVCLTFDTAKFTVEMRKFLLLFLDLIQESPVQLADKQIPYEAVVAALEEDMISYETSLGVQSSSRFGAGAYSQTLTFHMQVEVRKFKTAVEWMTNLIFNTVFTQERVHIIGSKLVNDIASSKRDGYGMARDIMKAIYFKKNTNSQTNAVLSQHTFLTELLENLKDAEKWTEIEKNLNAVRETLIPTMTVHVAANFDKVTDLASPLKPLSERIEKLSSPPVDHLPVTFDYELMNSSGNIEGDYSGTVVGIGCVESGFLFCSSPGLSNFLDKDLSALLLYLQYLSQLEGPMWKKIRKNSYGYHIVPKPNEGLIVFGLYRATNIYEAFKDAKTIIEGELEDGVKFDETLLESAKSSLIFEIIEREKTVSHLEQQALLSSFKGVPVDYNKNLVNEIANVTHDDLRRVGKRFFKTIFHPDSAKIVIVCHPDKVEAVKTQFEEFGHKLKTCSSLETSILNDCN